MWNHLTAGALGSRSCRFLEFVFLVLVTQSVSVRPIIHSLSHNVYAIANVLVLGPVGFFGAEDFENFCR